MRMMPADLVAALDAARQEVAARTARGAAAAEEATRDGFVRLFRSSSVAARGRDAAAAAR